MLPAQRIQQILQHITEHGVGTVSDLSQKYQVSEMTVRRDLKLLEEQGYVKRTHGGAIISSQIEPRYVVKQQVQTDAKNAIARYAAQNFIADGDIILMEGGTTVTMMAQYLADYRHLTIVTNGLFTLQELRGLLKHHTVISTGGLLRDVSFTFVGPTTEAFFAQFHANKVFLSATGWDAKVGFTDPNIFETTVKRAMLKVAEQRILLVDASKFGVISLSSFLEPYDIHALITDPDTSPDVVAHFQTHKVDICIAP